MPASLIIAAFITAAPVDERINLVEFARVVEFQGDGAVPIGDRQRGTDGWEAYPGPDGSYMIGVCWDSPRDIAEVGIEFRHAIGNRGEIKVQFWREEEHGRGNDTSIVLEASGRGAWVTLTGDWWAGDRDVNYLVAPPADPADRPGVRTAACCRTTRLRFLCGGREPPPVRYLRAYGPEPVREASFHIDLAPDAALKWPLRVEAVNGLILEGSRPTTTRAASLDEDAPVVQIRYVDCPPTAPNHTSVTIYPRDESEAMKFAPGMVVQKGAEGMNLPGGTVTGRPWSPESRGTASAPAESSGASSH